MSSWRSNRSEDHLGRWLKTTSFERGYAMTLATAFRFGKIWYAGRVSEEWEPRSRAATARVFAEVGLESDFYVS